MKNLVFTALSIWLLASCSGSGSPNETPCTESEVNCSTQNDIQTQPGDQDSSEEGEENNGGEVANPFSLPQSIEIISVDVPLGKMPVYRFDDTGTDYENHRAGRWPAVQTLETISLTNTYLCFLNHLNIEDFVNQGTYQAEVDANLCDYATINTNRRENFLVNVTQASEDSPRVADVWWLNIMIPAWPEILTAFLHIEISEGVSEEKPLGDWSISYRIINDKGSTFADSESIFTGGEGTVHISHYYSSPFYSLEQSITKVNDSQGTSHAIEGDIESSSSFNFTFDENVLLDSYGECKNLNQSEDYVDNMLIFETDTGNLASSNEGFDSAHFPAFYYEGETQRLANLSSLGVIFSDHELIDTSIFHDGHTIERYQLDYLTGNYLATGELYTLTLPAPVSMDEEGVVTDFVLENADMEIHIFSPLIQFIYTHSNENDRLGNALHTDPISFIGLGTFYTEGLNIKDGITVGDSDEYVLKAASIGIHYQDASIDACNHLDIGSPTQPLPDAVEKFDSLKLEIPAGEFTSSVIDGETI